MCKGLAVAIGQEEMQFVPPGVACCSSGGGFKAASPRFGTVCVTLCTELGPWSGQVRLLSARLVVLVG